MTKYLVKISSSSIFGAKGHWGSDQIVGLVIALYMLITVTSISL